MIFWKFFPYTSRERTVNENVLDWFIIKQTNWIYIGTTKGSILEDILGGDLFLRSDHMKSFKFYGILNFHNLFAHCGGGKPLGDISIERYPYFGPYISEGARYHVKWSYVGDIETKPWTRILVYRFHTSTYRPFKCIYWAFNQVWGLKCSLLMEICWTQKYLL